MRLYLHSIVIASALAALVLAAGCGDDGSTAAGGSTASGPNTASRTASTSESEATNSTQTGNGAGASAEFVEAANATCAQSQEEIRSELQPYLQKTTGEGSKDALIAEIVNEVMVPGFQDQIADLEALELSGSDSKQLAAVVGAIENMIAEARARPTPFTTQDQPFLKVERVADKVGLTSCGRL